MIASCPADVVESIERRCSAARAGRLQPYGDMLRANILDAVSSMFPRFAARRGETLLARDVDDFVQHHGAARAQFVHISTEFLLFSEGRFDTVTRTLLEYEWMLFSVDASEEAVTAPGEGAAPESLADVRLNPTLQLIAVPFDLDQETPEATWTASEDQPPFVYAVYRTPDHRVVTQGLTSIDISALRELADGVSQRDSEGRSEWIGDALRLGLVVARHTC